MKARLRDLSPTELVVSVSSAGKDLELNFRADRAVWQTAPANLDFAAVALVHFASARGDDLHLCGPVTRTQLDHLDEFLQIWSVWRPDLFKRIRLTADAEINDANSNQKPGVIAFSGGVDSAFSLLANASGLLGRLTRPINLGVLAVGWDIRHSDSKGIVAARGAAAAALAAFGADCVTVATNWQQDFCPDWLMGFNTGVSAILQTFGATHGSGIMSGDFSYLEEMDIGPYGSHTTINHLLGSPTFPIFTAGGPYSRLERVRSLLSSPVLMRNLRVCYQANVGGKNCGRCEKCIRTQLEIIAAGGNPAVCFPNPMTVDDLRAIRFGTTLGPRFLKVALDALPEEHPMKAVGFDVMRTNAEINWDQDKLAIENRLLRRQLDAIYCSRSWRITAPMRALKSAFNALWTL